LSSPIVFRFIRHSVLGLWVTFGTYTGLWTATIGLAGLISPPIYGLVVDTFGFGAFFVPGIVFMTAGLVCTLGITEGSRGLDADAG
jgi:sugar phosphate permease